MSDAIEAACRAHSPQWDGIAPEIQRYAREQMRAALTAYEAAKGGGSGVKPLAFDANGRTQGAFNYTIDRIGDCFYVRSSEATGLFATIESTDTLEAAKAAAQADYEARIRSALTSPASGERDAPAGYVLVPVEPTAEMLRAGMDDLGWWVEPYEAPRESGVPIDSDMSAEDAAAINAQQIEVVASCYRAMARCSVLATRQRPPYVPPCPTLSEAGMSETTNAVPPPGSDAAIAKGCTCPVLDNGRGRGYYGQLGVYVYTVGCPVHAPAIGMGTTNTAVRSIEGGERG